MDETLERLRVARETLNMSNEEFAELLDVSAGYYRNIECGSATINPNFLKKLFRRASINPDYIMKGEGEAFVKGKNDYISQQINKLEEKNVEYTPKIRVPKSETEVEYLRRKLDELTIVLINLSADKKTRTAEGA